MEVTQGCYTVVLVAECFQASCSLVSLSPPLTPPYFLLAASLSSHFLSHCHFPSTHTFPAFQTQGLKSIIGVPDWLHKGIIILQYGKMCLFVVWARTRVGKLAPCFPSLPPSSKNRPSLAIPTPKSFLLPIKCMYWQAGEGVSPSLRSSAPSCCRCFSFPAFLLLAASGGACFLA